MVLRKPDLIAGSALLLSGIFFGWLAWRDFPEGSGNVPGPAFFPILLSTLLAVAGLYLIVTTIRDGGLPEVCFPSPAGLSKVLFLLVLYVGVFAWTPFSVSTVLFMAAVMAVMHVRSPLQILFFPISATLIIWVLFRFYLGVPLP
jgi:hypothetical protein